MPTPPRRRWYQFSLRTVLIFAAVIAMPLTWVAKERRQSQYEIQVAEQLIKEYGAAAKHDASPLPYIGIQMGGRFDEWKQDQDWWRDVARKILGKRVIGLQCRARDLEDLTPLASFSSLQMFACGDRDLSYFEGEMHFARDLTPLAKLKNLQSLTLSRCRLPDLSPVAELTSLKTLKLKGTDATAEQIGALRKSLPKNCTIECQPAF